MTDKDGTGEGDKLMSSQNASSQNEAWSASGGGAGPVRMPVAADGGDGGPAIHIDELRHYTAGDEAVMRDVLDIFRTQAALWLDQLSPDLSDTDWTALAHSLKGSARGIGALAFAAIAEEAETAPASSRPGLRARLGRELERVVAEIEHIITTL